MRTDLVNALTAASNAPGTALASAALIIASIEYPTHQSRVLPATAGRAWRGGGDLRSRPRGGIERRIDPVLRARPQRVSVPGGRLQGNERYEDPRNSCLNEVLEHRTGIPITLSIVYMEVARRAGLHIDGVNFPGHFLVRCPDVGKRATSGLLIDPFHGGALLSEHDCRVLLQKHVGSEIAFSKSLLAPATRKEIIVRMLLNLKRIYVHMRSFPQARTVTELLVALTPVGAERTARPRSSCVSPERRHRRAARSADVSQAVEHERDGQGRARRARPDLGARQDVAAPRRGAELDSPLLSLPWGCCLCLPRPFITIRC
jgi:hypothetical protein